MKKLVSLFLVLAMFLSLTPALAEEPVTVELWYCVAGANGDRMENIIAAYNASQDKVVVKGVYQGDYLPTLAKVKTSIAGGTIPCDILMIGSEYCIQLYEEDILVNLNPYFEKTGVNYDDFIEGLAYYFRDAEGNQYGIPFGRSTPALFVNTDMLAELGAEVPTTWDAMQELCKKAIAYDANGEQSRYGWAMAADEWYWLGFLASHGVQLLNDEQTALGCVEDGSLKRAVTRLQEMYQAGEILITPTSDGTVPMQAWAEGKSLFFTWSVAGIGSVRNLVEFNWNIATMPADQKIAVPTGGNGLAILDGTGKEDAAYDFIHWLMTDPNGALYFVKETGYYPFTYSMAESEAIQQYFAEVPGAKVAFDQLQYADDSGYYCNKLAEIRNALNVLMEAVIFDGADVQEQIDIMAESVADALAD